jgi:hypothetical protein
MVKNTKHKRSSKRSTVKRTLKSKYFKCSTSTLPQKSYIIRTLIEMVNVVKLYHWKTHSFPEHKNTDELHERLNEHMDKFVEVYLGKDGSRIKKWESKINAVQYENTNDFKTSVLEYRDFLINLSNCFSKSKDSDLLNIRDEMLADINQFLYLLTFK